MAGAPSGGREQDLSALRAEMERKYHDLRVETHGWAEVAIKAGNKVDQASDTVNLIYTQVHEVRAEIGAVRGAVCDVRDAVVGVCGDVAQIRAEQDAQRETLASIERELGEQGDTLQKILAKLS